jgi:hypothetical protein
MAGKIVKTKSGKIGQTKNGDEPIYCQVIDNSNPFMLRTIEVKKIKVYFDDGTRMICEPKNLELIGFWD